MSEEDPRGRFNASYIVCDITAKIVRAKVMAGIMHALGVPSTPYIQYAERCAQAFDQALRQARVLDPTVPWELCVDTTTQQIVCQMSSMYPSDDILPQMMQGTMEAARAIKNVVYMAEKTQATLQ